MAEADGEGSFCGRGTEIAHFGRDAETEIEKIRIRGDTETLFEFANEIVLVEANVGGKIAHGEILLVVRFDVFDRRENIAFDGGGKQLDGKEEIQEGFERAFNHVLELFFDVRTAVIRAVVFHRTFHEREDRGEERMLVECAHDGGGGDQGRGHDEMIKEMVKPILGVLTNEKGKRGRKQIETVFLQLHFLVSHTKISASTAHIIQAVRMSVDIGDPFAGGDTAAAKGQCGD